jgi:hypothetical protein
MRNAVKGTIYVYTPPCTPHIMPSTSRDMATISKMGHTIIVGLPTLRVRRQNPPDGSQPPRASIARDEATQGVSTSWHIWSPIEGTWCPQASYLSLDREVSFTPPSMGWQRATWVFYADYPGKKHDTTWSRFDWGH